MERIATLQRRTADENLRRRHRLNEMLNYFFLDCYELANLCSFPDGDRAMSVPRIAGGWFIAPPLLDIVHQVQIREGAAVFVDVIVAVGGDQNRADIGHSRHIRQDQLFPWLLVSGSQVQFEDLSGHLAKVVQE